jgi:hypothetical protein
MINLKMTQIALSLNQFTVLKDNKRNIRILSKIRHKKTITK